MEVLKDLVAYWKVVCPSVPVDREIRYFPNVIFEEDIAERKESLRSYDFLQGN